MKQTIQIENISSDELKGEIIAGVCERLIPFFNVQEQVRPDDEYITAAQTQKLVKSSSVTVWKWTKEGILTSYKIGRKVLYKKSEVLSAIAQQETL